MMNSQIHFSMESAAATEPVVVAEQEQEQKYNHAIDDGDIGDDDDDKLFNPYFGVKEDENDPYFIYHGYYGFSRSLSCHHHEGAHDIAKKKYPEGQPYEEWAGSTYQYHINTTESYYSCRDANGRLFRKTKYEIMNPNYPKHYDLDANSPFKRPSPRWSPPTNSTQNESQSIIPTLTDKSFQSEEIMIDKIKIINK